MKMYDPIKNNSFVMQFGFSYPLYIINRVVRRN